MCNCESIQNIPPATLRFISSATVNNCKLVPVAIALKGLEIDCEAAMAEGVTVWFVPKKELVPNVRSFRVPSSAVEVVE